jgi:hypothetical protein
MVTMTVCTLVPAATNAQVATDSARTAPPAPAAMPVPPPPVTAEPWFRPGTWFFRLDIGGAAFSDFQRGQARAVMTEASAGGAVAGRTDDFQRRVSAGTSVTMGGSVSYWIGRSWGLRAHGAWVPTRFTVWTEESMDRLAAPGAAEDAATAYDATLGVIMADAAMLFRFPHTVGRVIPYGVLGGGVVQYRSGRSEELPPEARRQFARGSRMAPAAVLGIGAVLPLERHGLLLAFELTDHLSTTPLDDAGRGEWFEIGGVPVQIAPDAATGGTDGVALTNNLRLTIGLTLPVR